MRRLSLLVISIGFNLAYGLLAVLNGDYIADSRLGLCMFAKTELG